jgi:maltodextrin utilization protein YvdJ
MNTTYLILIVLAVIIIAALSTYAVYLTRKVKAVEQRQAEEEAEAALNLRNKQLELVSDIRFIARSVLEAQCEITEGVLRLHYLIQALDPDTWHQDELATVRQHYGATSAMPILDAYKQLSKKEQFQLDKQRLTLEDQHKNAIERELKWLVTHSFPTVTLIQ